MSRAVLIVLGLLVNVHGIGDSLNIVSFGTSADKSTVHKWESVSDPVMGGSSHADFAETDDYAVFSGEVKVVWFLGAPGFCNLQTSEKQQFPDLTSYDGLSFKIRNKGELTGIQIMMSTEHSNGQVNSFMSHGTKHGSYVAHITVPSDGELHDVTLAWSDFATCQWRGEEMKCPAVESQLAEIEQIGLSFGQAPHKAGSFNIQLHSITAEHIDSNTTPTPSPSTARPAVDVDATSATCVCAGVHHARYGGADCNDKPFNGRHFCYVEPGACSDGADLVAKHGVAVEGMEWSYAVCEQTTAAAAPASAFGAAPATPSTSESDTEEVPTHTKTATAAETGAEAEAEAEAEADGATRKRASRGLPLVFGALLIACLGAALVVYKRRLTVLKARLDYEMNDVRNVAFGGAVPAASARGAVAIAVNSPMSAADQAAVISKPINAAEL
jgi:hypothetical protein